MKNPEYVKSTKVKLSEEEKDNLRKQKIIDTEKKRISIEKYHIKEISSFWEIISGIVAFGLVALGIYFYISNKETTWYLWVGAVLVGLFAFAYEVQENWEKRLEIKADIKSEDPSYTWVNGSWLGETVYFSGYIFTDSVVEKITYISYKTLAYLTTILAVISGGVLLFLWLGSITIAPTTLIIILLIIIIVNQNKGRN